MPVAACVVKQHDDPSEMCIVVIGTIESGLVVLPRVLGIRRRVLGLCIHIRALGKPIRNGWGG